MSNSYYNAGSFPATGTPATSASMRAELALISGGFDRLPALSGNANKLVLINGAETGMTTLTPPAGDLVGTTATQTLTNKTISGTFTGSLTGAASLNVLKTGDTMSGGLTYSPGTANGVAYLNASKVLTSGSGLTFDGTALTMGANPTLSAGTVNGILYLNGSKVATSGSALTFDGTNLIVGTASGYGKVTVGNAGSTNYSNYLALNGTDNAANGSGILGLRNGTNAWLIGDTASALGSGTGFISYNYGTSPWIWYLQTGGEQMRLTSTGLGIGTSSPAWRVHAVSPTDGRIQVEGLSGYGMVFIQGSSGNSAQLQLNSNGGTGRRYSIVSSPTGSLLVSDETATTTRVTLDSSGNLGLSVTPGAWISNAKALQISSFLSAWQGSNGSANLGFNVYEGGINTYQYSTTGDAPTMYQQLTGSHAWFSAPSGTAGNTIAFTRVMNLDASGNLALGQSSAAFRLDVLSGADVAIRARSSNSNEVLRVESAGTSSAQIRFINTSVNNTYISAEGTALTFLTAATERARITSTGNQIDYQPAESAQNTSVTLTFANLQARIITSNAAVTLTLPTGTSLEGYTTSMATDTAFEVTFIATTANAITIGANGNTTVGSLTVAGNTSGTYRFRKTATNTFTVYRIS